jgi:hypothetical protein
MKDLISRADQWVNEHERPIMFLMFVAVMLGLAYIMGHNTDHNGQSLLKGY